MLVVLGFRYVVLQSQNCLLNEFNGRNRLTAFVFFCFLCDVHFLFCRIVTLFFLFLLPLVLLVHLDCKIEL